MTKSMSADPIAELAAEHRALSNARAPLRRIGGLLLDHGLITEEELSAALDMQRRSGQRLGEILVDMGAVSAADLSRVLGERLTVPFIDLRAVTVDRAIATLVPEEVARRHTALPFAEADGHLYVAMAEPNDQFALDDLRRATQLPIAAVIAEPNQIRQTLDRIYRTEITNHVDAATGSDGADDAHAARLVNLLLEQAINERASDIHIEPLGDRARIRFRTDGVLHQISEEAPTSVLQALVSRVQALAGLDITRRRVPQDGRFSALIDGVPLDVRFATIPTAFGESLVMRLSESKRGPRDFEALGMSDVDRAPYEDAYLAPQGCIIVSGPTGSGKTSTLYTTLLALNTVERSVVTVEDPVEYQLPGIKQVKVEPSIGLSFASALRSILGADPDVVMVGDMRDVETARIATEAVSNKCLVLSTLHASSAATVPLVLMDMGVEPFVVASALSCVVAQRLVRRLCDDCAEPQKADAPLLRRLGLPDHPVDGATIRRAVGCPGCHGTGYRGRIALFETMTVGEEIRRLIVGGASSTDIERRAVANGMDTLRIAAVRRVLDGSLSIDEMMRAVR